MANIFWLNVSEAANVAADGNEKMISIKDQTGLIISIRDATEKEINTSTKPRSIPDPWARAYLFNRYVLHEKLYGELSDVQKEQHDRLLGAWRGFFAMLALSQVYDISVQIKKVEGCDGIGAALWRNRPETAERNRIHPDLTDADSAYLIYANGQAAGFTDAGIAVLPGGSKGRFDETYPWSDGLDFVDPTARLTRGERMIVYAWVHRLTAFYDESEQKPKVLQPLKAYLKDLNLSKSDMALAKQAAEYTLQAHMLKETPLQPLEERIKLNRLEYSETRIDGSPYCLVDLADNIEAEKERLVIGLLDERMLNRNDGLFKLFAPAGEKLELVRASDMFLDKYYVFDAVPIERDDLKINSSAMFIADANKRAVPGRVHLFPMKSAYVHKLQNVIAGGFEMSVAAGHLNAGVGFMVNGEKRTLVRDYPPEAQTELMQENMATTVIWPNIPDCRQYHTAVEWSKYGGTSNAFAFVPVDAEIEARSTQLKMRYILADFPKYLKALWVDHGTAQVKDCGVAMMKTPDPLSAGQVKINYALDFGTSASIAAYNTGSAVNSKKVDFSNQIVLITSDIREANLANKLMLGIHDIDSPFPTVYYKDPFPTAVLFQGGHPYFELPNKIVDRDEKDNKSHLETNIKFELGDGGDNSVIQKDYIKGLIHMLLIHARKLGARQTTLKVSYPISIRGIEEFKENIRDIIKSYAEKKDGKDTGGYPYGVELTLESLQFITESEAATRYFYSASKPKECITLDIGGGSADLFTYSSKNKGSAMIASVVAGSREFLLKMLWYRKNILLAAMNEIGRRFPESALETKWFDRATYNDMEIDTFNSSLECLFQFNISTKDGKQNNIGEEIGKIIRTNNGQLANERNAHVLKQMKTIWLFQLAAFFYYGGLMYKKDIGKGKPLSNTTISFFLSGRGSQIVNWLPLGSTEKVLIEMVRKALDVDADVVIKLYQETGSKKTESAIGMLKDAISNDGNVIGEDNFTFDYVAGEEYTDNKGKINPAMSLIRHKCSLGREGLKSHRMDEDFKEVNPDLPVLSHFITSLNQSLRNSELDDMVYRIALCDTPSEAEKLNGHPNQLFYMDKSSLSETVAHFKTKIDNGTSSVDIPLFFYLTNIIRKEAIDEWVGKE